MLPLFDLLVYWQAISSWSESDASSSTVIRYLYGMTERMGRAFDQLLVLLYFAGG